MNVTLMIADSTSAPKSFQERCAEWVLRCMGGWAVFDTTERSHRFLEEALELCQAVGCTKDEAKQLVDYVFDRPAGEVAQEVGGVATTFASLCNAVEIDQITAGETELARCWQIIEAIRAKWARKPKFGPLPGASAPTFKGEVVIAGLRASEVEILAKEPRALRVLANHYVCESLGCQESSDREARLVRARELIAQAEKMWEGA